MRIILLFCTLLLSFNVKAWNLDRVGTIEAKTWNDFMDGFTTNEIYISAGSDGETSNVRLSFDIGFERYPVTYVFDGLDSDGIRGLDELRSYLDKSIEWTKVAKDNSAETQKTIGSSCGTYSTSCKATFFSSNNANQTDLILEIKEDADFTFNEGTFYIEPEEVKKMRRFLSVEHLRMILERSKKKNSQAEDLFN